MTRLGPFERTERLGRGGMGEVWAATHVPSGQPVAVKVLHRATPGWEHEVEAMARLHHRHVVQVLELGHSGGVPWFAMERATGDLGPWQGQASWPRVATWLRQLLEALAHAHAVGVLHRDVKPSNMLLDPDGNVLLADFGIAWPAGAAAPSAVGSVASMAPEQVVHAWRSFGPWTDLYAVGCVGWSLVCGSPPFTGSADSVREAHRTHPLPPFAPVIDAPSAVGDWLRELLQKHPRDRPPLAADALAAFPRGTPIPAVALPPEPASPGTTVTPSRWLDPMPPHPPEAVSEAPPGRTSPPATWPESPTREAPRWAVGLGLYGMRTVPHVGQPDARDVLWKALHDAHAGRPRRLAIRSGEDLGARRLAMAFAEAAHACGAAWAWPQGGRSLREAFGTEIRCSVAADAAATLTDWGVPNAPVLARWLGGDDTPRERLIEALYGWIAHRDRPLVWWIDEPDDDTIALADALTTGSLRLVVLATTPTPPHGWVDVPLQPLTSGEQQRLMRHLLGLDGSLAGQVEARANGRSGVIVDLVSNWVARGVLEPTGQGFRLRPGVAVHDPGTLDERWARRLERWDQLAVTSLEIAAAIGPSASLHTWRAACQHVRIPADARPALSEGVARRDEDHLILSRPLHRALQAHAQAHDRWASHHEAVLTTFDGTEDPGRRGLHRAYAGDSAGAAPDLLEGAELAYRSGQLARALHLLATLSDIGQGTNPVVRRLRARILRGRGRLDEADALLEGLDDPESWWARMGHALDRAQLDDAETYGQRALKDLPAGDPLEPKVWIQFGNIARRRGDAAATRHWMEKAAMHPERSADGVPLHALGLAAVASGDDADGVRWLQQARDAYDTEGLLSSAASCELEIGNVHQRASAMSEARDWWTRSLGRFERVGDSDAALPRLNLALADLMAGDIHVAGRGLRRALEAFERMDRAGMVAAVHACLLPVVVTDDDPEPFRRHLAAARRGLGETGMRDPVIRWAIGLAIRRGTDAARPDRVTALTPLQEHDR